MIEVNVRGISNDSFTDMNVLYQESRLLRTGWSLERNVEYSGDFHQNLLH
jgi:hypothetical protein